MNDKETNVIVGLLPRDDTWCKVEPAHMTLVYVGVREKLSVSKFNELVKDVASISMLSNIVTAKISGQDVFGTDERVDVLLVSQTPEILSIRRMLDSWDNSEFPSFEPHVTVGPQGSITEWTSQGMAMPIFLTFDRIAIMWGEERIPFWLKSF